MPSESLLNASQELAPVEAKQPSALESVSAPKRDEAADAIYDSLPNTLTLGGVDTRIPLSKKTSAFVEGLTDGVTDLWDGVSQITGTEETKRDLQDEQNRMTDLYNDKRFGTAARFGQFTGFATDPIGIVLPVAKGKALWKIATIGAATGAGLLGLSYVDEEQGQTRMGNSAIGLVTGGVLSPALFGVARGVKGLGHQIQERAADSMLDTYRKQVTRYMAEGANVGKAGELARKRLQYSEEDLAGLMVASNKPFSIAPKGGKAPMSELQASRNLAAMDNRLISKAGAYLDTFAVGRDFKSFAKSAKTGLAKGIIPTSTRIAQRDPDLARQLVAMEARTKLGQHKMLSKTIPFQDAVRKMDAKSANDLKLLLSSGEMKAAHDLFKAKGGSATAWRESRSVIDALFNGSRKAGYKIREVQGYFPRRVRDLEGLSTYQHGGLSEEIRAFIRIKGKQPTDKEINRMVQRISNPRQGGSFGTGGSLRNRKKQKITDEEGVFYHDINETLTSYVNDAVADIERARFFTGLGVKPKRGYKIDGTDLDDIIGGSLRARQKEGRYHAEELETLTDLLRSRFVQGEMAPSAAIQGFKNMTYIATLGNFKSAITQLGDLAFAAHRNGITNVALEIMNRIPLLRRIVKNSHKRITKEQIGLEDAIQDFAGDSSGKRALDWILSKTGFKSIDRLGKETFINAHYRKVQTQFNGKGGDRAKRDFINKWEPVFGDETTKLTENLSKGRFDDNVAVYLFSQLSEVQPVALSEMPQAYLNNPNGRIFYVLRSFTIKQLDLMRRDIYDNLAKGNAPLAFKNLASLGTLFVLANGSADMLKDFMAGKEIEMEDTLVDNVWKLVGLNKYSGDRITRGTPASAILDALAPPLTVWDRVIRAPSSSANLWKASPFNGSQFLDEQFNSGRMTRTASDDYSNKLSNMHDAFDRD